MAFTRLIKAEIIPTIISDFIPSLMLSVSWPNKTAKLGNTIEPKELQDEPVIKLHKIPSSSTLHSTELTYTIALTDPDAPSRDDPKWSEMCHWIAAKVPVSSVSSETDLKLKKLKDIMPWKPPGPPPKTGKHRYVFFAFVPANGTTKKLRLSKPSDRQHWGTGKEGHGVGDWAEENGLATVGKSYDIDVAFLNP
jgi:hypothetical protein